MPGAGIVPAVGPLIPLVIGLVALAIGVAVLRSFGPRYRIGRLLAATPVVSVGEARELAGGRPRYVAVRGRIDAEDEFEDDAHRPLVLRRARIELGDGDAWTTVDEHVRIRPVRDPRGTRRHRGRSGGRRRGPGGRPARIDRHRRRCPGPRPGGDAGEYAASPAGRAGLVGGARHGRRRADHRPGHGGHPPDGGARSPAHPHDARDARGDADPRRVGTATTARRRHRPGDRVDRRGDRRHLGDPRSVHRDGAGRLARSDPEPGRRPAQQRRGTRTGRRPAVRDRGRHRDRPARDGRDDRLRPSHRGRRDHRPIVKYCGLASLEAVDFTVPQHPR